MAVVKALSLFFFLFSLKAAPCGDQHLWNYQEIDVCFIPNEFVVYEKGREIRSFSPVHFSFEETVVTFLEKKIGKENTDSFLPHHQRVLGQFNKKAQEKLTYSMTEGVVEGLALLNDNNAPSLKENCHDLFGESLIKGAIREIHLRCQIKVKELPSYLLDDFHYDDYANGEISLHKLMKANPDIEFTMKSKALSNEEGNERVIDKDAFISIADYSSFHLLMETKEGRVSAVGSCRDSFENSFNLFPIAEEKDPKTHYSSESGPNLSEGEYRPSGIKLANHWYLPVSVDFEEVSILERNGERTEAYNVGIDTGLTYRVHEGQRSYIDVMPSVGIPILDQVRGPMDALNPRSYSIGNFRPDYVGVDVTIRW